MQENVGLNLLNRFSTCIVRPNNVVSHIYILVIGDYEGILGKITLPTGYNGVLQIHSLRKSLLHVF